MAQAVALERIVTLDAVHNFRDLGGYETGDGRVTRWHTLYRADGLQRLRAGDIDTIRPFGLRTVLDLRTHRELEERGRFPVEALPVRFHHLPVIDVTWETNNTTTDAVGFLFEQYQALLAYGEPLFAKAFHLLAVPGALPAVFHCAAGKDRTGVLAALILGAVGVPHEVIAEDYGLSRAAMVRTRAWADATSPELAAAWSSVPSTHLAAEPEAMRALLDQLASRHGSIREYVVSIGASNAVLSRLTAAFLAAA